MAQKVQIILEDDLDGGEASETVSFGLDGTNYEIDLNEENATALREAFAAYVGHARKVTGARRGAKKSPAGQGGPRVGPGERLRGPRPRPHPRRRA